MKTRLALAAVVKSFGRHRVLDKASLQVSAGETVGLLGANGAGKTTLLRIAAGLIRPDEGSVRWLTASAESGSTLRYFGGESTLPPDVRGSRWAALFGVEVAESRAIGRLSRGSRQRLGLRVLLAGAVSDLVILDEPWEGLDPAAAAWLSSALRQWREAGAAILVSSHRLHDLDLVCTRFVMLDHGRCDALPERDSQPRLAQIERAFLKAVPRC